MTNVKKNPWYRALARFCDYCLFFLVLGAVTLSLPYFYGPYFYYYLALAVPILWMPIEAFFIAKWSTTPGKALFGISVWGNHTELMYFAALRRALFIPRRPGVVHYKPISWKRKLLGFAASAAFMLAAVYGNVLSMWSVGLEKGISPDGWVEYSSADVGFKVSFPTDPEHESKELVIPDSGKVLNYDEITSSENEKVSYTLSHMVLPRKWRLAGDTTLLKGTLDAIVTHTPGAQLLSKEFTVHQGYRALDFVLLEKDNQVKGRLILVGGTLYKLTMDYPPSQAEEMAENPFISSFEIT